MSTPEQEADPELEELMSSALEDMNAPQRKRGNSIGGSSIKPAVDGVDWNPSENVWTEEFLEQAASTFQSSMASLLSSMKGTSEENVTQEQVAATFQMMAEAAAQVMKPTDETKMKSPNDVSAAIAQTLESLNSNVDDLKKPVSDDELVNMFSGLGVNNDDNMFVPFMQNMMQSLLSKDVLYPSLKSVVEKYPDWLIANKSKLDKKEYERYSKQSALMARVCSELERERESDPEDVKKKRFDVILELMQQMQNLGQPPAELADDYTLGEGVGGKGMSLPDPNQCRPM